LKRDLLNQDLHRWDHLMLPSNCTQAGTISTVTFMKCRGRIIVNRFDSIEATGHHVYAVRIVMNVGRFNYHTPAMMRLRIYPVVLSCTLDTFYEIGGRNISTDRRCCCEYSTNYCGRAGVHINVCNYSCKSHSVNVANPPCKNAPPPDAIVVLDTLSSHR